jgi:hypothetical protein
MVRGDGSELLLADAGKSGVPLTRVFPNFSGKTIDWGK